MSTSFYTQDTGEYVCTRWAGRKDGQAWDFGNAIDFDGWFTVGLCLDDVPLVGENGEVTSVFTIATDSNVILTFGEAYVTRKADPKDNLPRRWPINRPDNDPRDFPRSGA